MTQKEKAEAPIIELRHVDKHYGDLHVLKDISLEVDRGRCHRAFRFRQINHVPNYQPSRDH